MDKGEIYGLARAVGLSESKAKVAAAIAMAESGGNPKSHNTDSSTGDNSYGLWQINMLGTLGPARRAQFGLKSNDDLFDPEVNARVMSEMSKQGQDFSPWSTYKRGNYKAYMDFTAKDLLNPWEFGSKVGARAAEGAGNVGDTYDALATGAKAVVKAGAWLSDTKNWVRVAYVTGGIVVVTIGLVAIMKPYLGDVANVIPAGKVAKLVKGK